MKKLIYLLTYILIFNILICLTLLLDIYSDKNQITQSSIEISTSSNDNYNLIQQILKDTNKKDLIKFINYIGLEINQSIENDKNNYTSFTITLPQNNSFIAFYKKNNNNTYTFSNYIDNLSNINNFYFNKNFLIIEQYIKNSSSSMKNHEFIEIFYNQGDIYLPSLKKDILKEYYSSSSNKEKNIISSSIDFLDGDLPRIVYVSTHTKLEKSSTTINNNTDFIEKDKLVSKEIYEWNPNLYTFELSDKEIINNK